MDECELLYEPNRVEVPAESLRQLLKGGIQRNAGILPGKLSPGQSAEGKGEI